MVASHVGEYGDFGEFLSNHQIYVNQFHTWFKSVPYISLFVCIGSRSSVLPLKAFFDCFMA